MKVLFVGIGSIAKRHINNLKSIEPSVEIHAFRREEKPIENVSKVYTNINKLPNDYDIIFITNPTEYHADMLIKLNDRGKHFFIEKPITSLNAIEALDKFNYKKNSIYYVACPLRYDKVIDYVKENIDINSVNSIRCISSSYLPDWRPYVDYKTVYSAHKDLGGGVDIDLIHEWDYITYIFGFPFDIKMFCGKVSNLEIDSNDYAIYISQYNKMIAELHLDYFGRKTVRNMIIYTNDDTIDCDILNGIITYMKSDKTINLSEDRNDVHKRELEFFLNLIKENKESTNDPINAIKVLKLTQGVI